jgi:hypothetical protein
VTRPLLLLAALSLASAACEKGNRYDCSCSFLTDYDDASKQLVEVCAPSLERAAAFAKGCAQSGAPAPIQACVCRPGGAEPCRAGACSTNPRGNEQEDRKGP